MVYNLLANLFYTTCSNWSIILAEPVTCEHNLLLAVNISDLLDLGSCVRDSGAAGHIGNRLLCVICNFIPAIFYKHIF